MFCYEYGMGFSLFVFGNVVKDGKVVVDLIVFVVDCCDWLVGEIGLVIVVLVDYFVFLMVVGLDVFL